MYLHKPIKKGLKITYLILQMNNGKLVPSHCVTNVTMFINITQVTPHSLWRFKEKKEKDQERVWERSWSGWKLKLCH